MMKLNRSSRHGSVLVTVLVITGIIGMMLVAYLSMTATQNAFTMRSLAWNSAMPMAEAGVEEALAHLNAGGSLASDGWTNIGSAYAFDRTLPNGYVHILIDGSSPPVITATGYVRAPFQNQYIARAIRAPTRSRTPFAGGVTSKGVIKMSGGSVVDSFDSSDPAYSTNGAYSAALHKDNGALQSTATSSGAIQVGTGKVYGTVATGPGGTVTVSGAVGDTAFVNNPANAGKIQSGHVTSDVNLSLEDVKPPDLAGTWGAPVAGSYNGTNYLYKLGSGTYDMASVTLSDSSKSMVVTGDAVLYVPSNFTISGSGYIYVAPGAKLKVYVGSTTGSSVTATISGGGVANGTGLASNFSLFGLPTCTKVTYSGSAQFIGTLYAPEADLTMSGSAAGVGALVAQSVTFSGGMSFHYDESLGGNPAKYVVTFWQEI